ncbi:MAG TPA: hypothetical protein VGD58_31570 [Herpetosiphonaceae bacterium]
MAQASFDRRSKTGSACHTESVYACLRVLWLQNGNCDLSEVQEQREAPYDHQQNDDEHHALGELALFQAGAALSHVHKFTSFDLLETYARS